ncbi:hypothetical protein AKJ16_DCAP08704, partial [Drosera capensis]
KVVLSQNICFSPNQTFSPYHFSQTHKQTPPSTPEISDDLLLPCSPTVDHPHRHQSPTTLSSSPCPTCPLLSSDHSPRLTPFTNWHCRTQPSDAPSTCHRTPSHPAAGCRHCRRELNFGQKDEAWRVNVRIQGCDLESGYLYGIMEALNVPMADTPVVTFWEGEIVDTKTYTFYTGEWEAAAEDDIKHWTKLPSFMPLLVIKQGLSSLRLIPSQDVIYRIVLLLLQESKWKLTGANRWT